MEFREGKPADYVSLSVGYEYHANYSEFKKDVDKFFEDIQPEKSERDYLLMYLASILEGNNTDENFNIFSGSTRNGKSKLADLIEVTLGQYFGNIQSTMLTEKRPSQETPQPGLLNLKKKRVVMTSEPEASKKINTGFVKAITGRDKFTGRYLHSNEEITFVANFKLILLCNDKPKIDKLDDYAFWNRCRCIEFPITFTEHPKNKNEKLMDKNLNIKMKKWKNDFMLTLLEFYKIYKKNGLEPTNNVLKYTQQYKEDNNYFDDFISETVEKNIEETIKWTDLKDKFTEWYTSNYDNHLPDIKFVKSYFEKYFGCKYAVHKIKNTNITVRGWKGWSLKND